MPARARNLRSGSDVAVYRDQLDEIDRDRAAGRIAESEATAAQVEVSRRLIAAADAQAGAAGAASPASAVWRRRAVALSLLSSCCRSAPRHSISRSARPGCPTSRWRRASAVAKQNQSIESLIAQVEAHLERNPNDGRGWEVIAPIYLRLGRFEDAVKARRNALRLNGETAERQTALGEALVYAANGIVTAEAKAAFERAVALDQGDVKGRYFLGLAAEQDGNLEQAAAIWRAMLAGAPPDAPWAEFVRQALARVGAARAARAMIRVAAASDLSPEQRAAMIRGMVERLAERLARDGSDVEGWLRLVRSYMVLGDREKARAAVADARRALASAPDKLRRLDELAKGLGLEG